MKSYFLILLTALPITLWAQRSGNPQKTYQSGKNFYNSGQYHMAAETFKSITTYSNSYTEYATFYYGLSSYYNGQEEIAKNILLQLSRKYPNWNKNYEVQYWLGKLYLEKGDYALALDQLNRISNNSLSADVASLKRYHLSQASLEELEGLYENNPNDEIVAEALAKTMGQETLNADQLEQLQSIIDKFDLSEAEITNQFVGETTKKNSYKVAVCFPFMTADLKDDMRLNSNQWVIDLYQGIQLGHQKLLTENTSVELYAYDTERDSSKMAEILTMEEMESMDLIVGPLYPAPSELASAFAFDRKINILNPLSSNTEILSNNPYSFLFHPSDYTQALVSANFMKSHLNGEKKTLIIYGSRDGDSVAAYQYRQVLLDAGKEVIMMDQIPTTDSEAVAKFISDNLFEIFTPEPDDPAILEAEERRKKLQDDGQEVDEEQFIPRSDIEHVYVASSNELIVANIIGTIDNMGPKLTIMGNDRWLESRYVDFRQLERLQVYMAAPRYVDYNSSKFSDFQRRYLYKFKSVPNQYSFIGYDLMLLFGNMLQQGGNYFQHEIRQKEYLPGAIYAGYSFQNGNDNSYFPIVKFEEGVLTQVNNPGDHNE
jgi:hypothetical protein